MTFPIAGWHTKMFGFAGGRNQIVRQRVQNQRERIRTDPGTGKSRAEVIEMASPKKLYSAYDPLRFDGQIETVVS